MTKEEYDEGYADFIDEWSDTKKNVFEVHTSGSTGSPKNIHLPRAMMEASAHRTINYFGIDSDWLLVSCISGEYIGGKMMAVRAKMANSKFYCVSPSNHPDIRMAMEWESDSLIAVVPSQMWGILDQPFNDFQKRHMKFLIGGAPLPLALREKIINSGIEAWETYGMTETASHIAVSKVENMQAVFKVLPGIKIGLSSKDTLLIKIEGCDPIITNDMVEILKDGMFSVLGRLDNAIISGGLKIIPEQLENKLRVILSQLSKQYQFRPFEEISVTSKKDNLWGEALILLLESPDISAEDENKEDEDILKAIKEYDGELKLPRHEIPKRIIRVKQLPRTANGKIKRDSIKAF